MDKITSPQFPTNSMKTTRVLFPGVMQAPEPVGQKQNWLFRFKLCQTPFFFFLGGFVCFCCTVLGTKYQAFLFLAA